MWTACRTPSRTAKGWRSSFDSSATGTFSSTPRNRSINATRSAFVCVLFMRFVRLGPRPSNQRWITTHEGLPGFRGIVREQGHDVSLAQRGVFWLQFERLPVGLGRFAVLTENILDRPPQDEALRRNVTCRLHGLHNCRLNPCRETVSIHSRVW